MVRVAGRRERRSSAGNWDNTQPTTGKWLPLKRDALEALSLVDLDSCTPELWLVLPLAYSCTETSSATGEASKSRKQTRSLPPPSFLSLGASPPDQARGNQVSSQHAWPASGQPRPARRRSACLPSRVLLSSAEEVPPGLLRSASCSTREFRASLYEPSRLGGRLAASGAFLCGSRLTRPCSTFPLARRNYEADPGPCEISFRADGLPAARTASEITDPGVCGPTRAF